VDAVVIVLPQYTAGPVVLEALRAGKHVLTEKPLCTTLALGRQIVAEAERLGQVCLCSQNYRFEPGVIAVRDAIAAGKIGPIFLGTGRLIGPPYFLYERPVYRTITPDNPATVVLGNGVHGFDLLRFWLGEAATVSAVFRHVISRSFGGTGEDTGVCRIEFKQGAVVSFVVSAGDVSIAAGAWQFDLYGTESVLRWPEAVLLPKHPECIHPFRPGRQPVPPVALFDRTQQPSGVATLEKIHTHFVDVIAGKAAPQLPAAEALKSLELALAAVESAKAGGRVITF
jgi:predicted dehydrogenase